jgi:DNA repair protein RadC
MEVVMSTGPAAVFHRQPEPLPESADQVLLASIFERVLSREAGRAAAVDMIATFHGLAGVAAADEAALLRAGLHRGGVAELVRIRDMALAMTRAQACDRPVLSSWTALTAYLRAALAHAPREQFRTLYLDKRNILMCDEWRADGTIDHAPVYPREVVRRALELSASALILVHNHPSGDPSPSRPDIDMTRRVVEGARVFDIKVHDHVIVGREGTASFRALGLMEPS